VKKKGKKTKKKTHIKSNFQQKTEKGKIGSQGTKGEEVGVAFSMGQNKRSSSQTKVY